MNRSGFALSVALIGLLAAEAGFAQAAAPVAPTPAPQASPAQSAQAQAPQAQTPKADDQLGTTYAYCAAMFETLRKEDPAMVSGISPSVDATLREQAAARLPKWQLDMGVNKSARQGASDARQLVDKRGFMDRLGPEKDPQALAVGFARCWEVIQPWVKPAKPARK